MWIVYCIIIGLAAGVLGGLFGIGGGIIIVPALGLAFGFSQHKAQGTSLVALLAPVGLLALMNYYREGNADLVKGAWIAAAFFVGVAVVKQRLRLASVSPILLDVYADEGMTLEQLMAFTVSEDHARQEQVWTTIGSSWNKEPYQIRRMLTEAGYGPDAKPVEDERNRDYGDNRWGDPDDEA